MLNTFQELYKTMSEPSREVVELFFACADIIENISEKSIASYVISMTRQASHVMEVRSFPLLFMISVLAAPTLV